MNSVGFPVFLHWHEGSLNYLFRLNSFHTARVILNSNNFISWKMYWNFKVVALLLPLPSLLVGVCEGNICCSGSNSHPLCVLRICLRPKQWHPSDLWWLEKSHISAIYPPASMGRVMHYKSRSFTSAKIKEARKKFLNPRLKQFKTSFLLGVLHKSEQRTGYILQINLPWYLLLT